VTPQIYWGYGFSLDSTEMIDQVRVRLDAYGSVAGGQQIKLEVSTDGGTSWLTSSSTIILTTSPATYWIDVTGWTTWTVDKVNGNTNLQTRVTFLSGSETVYLDWIPVEVLHSGAPTPEVKQHPLISVVTDDNGEATINYPSLDPAVPYFAIVRARQSSLFGVGFASSASATSPVAPFVTDYKNGVITLVHRNAIDGGYPDNKLYYNALMVLPVGYSEYRNADLGSHTGELTPTTPSTISLGTLRGESGAIMIFTRRVGSGEYGVTIVPWGLCLGQRVTFGEDPIYATNISAKTRVAMVNKYTYMLKIEMWKKGGM
jgi:hypothetical protein